MRRLSQIAMIVAVAGAMLGLGAIHAAGNDYSFFAGPRFPWLIAWAAVTVILCYGFAIPEVGRLSRGLRRGFAAAFGSVIAISTAQLVVGNALLPRFVILGSICLVPFVSGVISAMVGVGHRQTANRDRILGVLTAAESETLASDLATKTDRMVTLVKTVDPQRAADELRDAVEASAATIVVMGRSAMTDTKLVEVAGALHVEGVRIRSLLMFYEEWVGKLPVSELQRSALLFDIGDVHKHSYRRWSRVLDIIVGVAGGVVLLVLLPFVLVGNLVANRGSLFYRQPRVGRGGATFNILKLRSMRAGAGPTEWTATDDTRVTAFGRFLRTSHLDELPQVINILRGELSTVGPRPEQPQYVEKLAETIPFYHSVMWWFLG